MTKRSRIRALGKRGRTRVLQEKYEMADARLVFGLNTDNNDIKINPAVTPYRQYCMRYVGVLQL